MSSVIVEDKETLIRTVVLQELLHELDERFSVCMLCKLPVERLAHIRAYGSNHSVAFAPI